jgi:voltage-gated potassium channel
MKILLKIETRYGRTINHALTMLSLAYLADYSWVVLGDPAGITLSLLNGFSDAVYALFAIDLAYRIGLFAATEKGSRNLRNFIISSTIPVIALIAPAFRTLRVFRLLLSLRGFVGLVKNRAESAGLLVALAFPLVAYTSALAIFDVERHVHGANILTFKDALWWALITMTTVGYGDHYPISDEGKLIAGGLLVAGITIFSTVTAIVSSWILADRSKATE